MIHIMRIIKNEPLKSVIALLFGWYCYSTYGTIFDIWHEPAWLLISGLFINFMCLIWCWNVFFGIRNISQRIMTTSLLLWYSPLWIYYDITHAPTLLSMIQFATVDITTLLCLIITNIYYSFRVIDIEIYNNDRYIDILEERYK